MAQSYKQQQKPEPLVADKKKFSSIETGDKNADDIQEEINDEVNELQPNTRASKPGDPL